MKKYQIIYADPPWSYADQGCQGTMANHYKGMKIDDILANKMIDLRIGTLPVIFLHIPVILSAPAFCVGYIPDRCIQPDIEIFILMSGHREPEIGAVSHDIPVLQSLFKPLADKFPDTFGNMFGFLNPLLQDIGKITQRDTFMG